MSADQTIALVSVVAGAVLGLAGLAATYAAAGREAAATRKLAAIERQQGRLSTAYLTLLEYALVMGNWAQTVRPIVDTNPPQPPPPFPPMEEQVRARALLGAYGSDEVKRLVSAWESILREIQMADQLLDWHHAERSRPGYRPGDSGIDTPEQWRKIDASKQAEVGAREQISAQVALELRGGDNVIRI